VSADADSLIDVDTLSVRHLRWNIYVLVTCIIGTYGMVLYHMLRSNQRRSTRENKIII